MTAGTAILSPCGTYRYVLTRHIPCVLRWVKPCLFVMLNPSIADASVNDPTIRRCIGFAKEWQCTSLTVVNLFAFRATSPADLVLAPDPYGPDNNLHVCEQMEKHRLGLIVAAWGNHRLAENASTKSFFRLEPVKCLGTTQSGAPRHPLYVRANTQLIDWMWP